MRRSTIASAFLLLVCLFGLNSCAKSQPGDSSTGDPTAAAEHHHDEGPHGGHIIELGSDSHHAELTHDEDSNRVGIYILDGSAKETAPIDADSLTINIAIDGKPTQYDVPAAPLRDDPPGKSSYFELVSEPLNIVVSGKSESQNTHARVNITIDGKPYVGMIETKPHDHDHDH